MPKTEVELRAIRDSVQKVGRLSDNIFRFGPIRMGLDGVAAWIPGVGELYSTAAGAFIIVQGVRTGVPATILVGAGLLLWARTLVTAVPLAGPLAADLFTAHRWAAALVTRAIDERLGAAPSSMSDDPPMWPTNRETGRAPVAL